MGQIIGGAAKPKRCNLNKLSQLGTPAAGEHILVSSDNSMNAAGQGNFDCYIVGDGRTAATALPLIKTYANDVDDKPTVGSDKLVKSGGVKKEVLDVIGEMVNKNVTVSGTTATSTAIYLKSGVEYVIYVKCTTAADNSNTGVYVYNGSSFTQIKQLNAAEYSEGVYIEYTAESDVQLFVRPFSSGTVKVIVWQDSNYATLIDIANKTQETVEKIDSMLNNKSLSSNVGYINHDGVRNAQSGWTYFQTNVNLGDKVVFTASNGGSSACYTCALIPYDGTETIVVATGSKTNFEYTAIKDGLLYVNNVTSQQAAPYLKFIPELGGKFTSNDIKNAIASEAFTYSNIVKTDGNLTSANITWSDGATGVMTVTYTNELPSRVTYSHILDGVTRNFEQVVTYADGDVVSNTINEI